MTEQNKTSINWGLVLPIGLLILEAIAVTVLILSGYEISQTLFFFLIFLAIFLAYQIFRQLSIVWRVKNASSQLTQAQAMIDANRPMEATKLLKEALFSLPKAEYLSALKFMEDIYEKQNMDDAVAQTKAVYAESIHLFDMGKQSKRFTQADKHNWQVQADKVRNMIQGLPEASEQSLSEARTDESSH